MLLQKKADRAKTQSRSPFVSVCLNTRQAESACNILPMNVVNIYTQRERTKMEQNEIRQRLIDGTICVIARGGLDKATTKQIGLATSINEAYIYRCFKNKEDMLAKTFDILDEELLAITMQHVEVMFRSDMEFVQRCRSYFFSVWAFLLGCRDKCLAYVQYFYSPYFTKYSAQTHKMRFAPLLAKFRTAFKDEADVWMILNHILNVMLDFAVKVHNDQMPTDDDYPEHVFRVIYASVKQYFRSNAGSEFYA